MLECFWKKTCIEQHIETYNRLPDSAEVMKNTLTWDHFLNMFLKYMSLFLKTYPGYVCNHGSWSERDSMGIPPAWLRSESRVIQINLNKIFFFYDEVK